ncbi:hypothetical protein HF086_004886 [Spodoptera exigua]|uniref:Uncharacterized protein n=1 Tax=Spodoptera exigua TaxID=7107 RepID=A0A922MTE5_SPOEX|nr:hypothetical protein HF086_004886 [Spodoptera exigua]
MASQDFVNIVLQRMRGVGAEFEGHTTDKMALKIDLEHYKVVNVKQKEWLVKNICGHDKIIVPWEDSFEIVWKLHLENAHPEPAELMDIMQKDYLINRNTIECISEVCPVCHGDNQPNVKYTLDIIPMCTDPDFLYSNILAYEDVFTKFVHLRPIYKDLSIDELKVELMRVFMDFGPPRKILLSHPVLTEALANVKDFRHNFDFDVIVKKVQLDFDKINRLKASISKWMRDNKSKKWGINIHKIEWELNNKINGRDHMSANSRVFAVKLMRAEREKLNLKNQAIENVATPSFYSRRDPVLPINITPADDPDDTFSFDMDDNLVNVVATTSTEERDSLTFEEDNIFQNDLVTDGQFDIPMFSGGTDIDILQQETAPQNYEYQLSEEMEEEAPPATEQTEQIAVGLPTEGFLAYTLNTTNTNTQTPGSTLLLIYKAPCTQVYPAGSEYF